MLKPVIAFCTALLLGSAMGAEETLPISLDIKKWHVGNNSKSCVIKNTEENGAQILEMTFSRTDKNTGPEARISFVPPVDAEKYTHLKFDIKVSAPTKEGWIALRDEGWKRQWKLWNIPDVLKGKILPAGKWVTVSTPFLNINKKAIIQLGIGFPLTKMKEGETFVMNIRNLCFSRKTGPADLEKRNQEFQTWIKNYKPDYSDGKKLLEPPTEGRLPAPLPIVRDGKPMAEIVYQEGEEDIAVATAARELQHYIREITGVTIPIVTNYWQSKQDGKTKILLGKRQREIAYGKQLFGEELKQLTGSDGFAVRTIGNQIYVFGAEGKGTMNGVYTLLANNTDIIWPRPNKELSAVFSKKKDLDFIWGNGLERPASRTRGWNGYADHVWMARNRCNAYYGGGGGDISGTNAGKRAYGVHLVRHCYGHNIGSNYLNPSKYFKDHPDYYSLVSGKRKPWAQMCFSNREMERVFTDNVLDMVRRAPDESQVLTIDMDDTWEACECPKCMAPIKLADGTLLKNDDPAFRSTAYFQFMNRVAAALVKEYPKMQIKTLAYFSTAIPPKCEVHPAIRPEFAPYVRVNDKTPLFSAENISWLERLQGWSKLSKNIDVYEYHGLGLAFPRPLSEVRAWDFREMHKYVVGITSEYNHNGDTPKNVRETKIWDYSAIELWTISHLLWNPDADVERLRKYYIWRTFREAAPEMEQFYGKLRENWYHTPTASTLGDSPVLLTQRHILDSKLETPLREHLVKAEAAAAHPVSKELVKRVRARFEEYIAEAKAIKTPSIAVPLIRPEGKVDFDHKAWKGAAVIDGWKKTHLPAENSAHKSIVKLFHDSKNLYLYFTFFDKDIKNIKIDKAVPGREKIAEDDHLELFLSDPTAAGVYYLFALDPRGARADLKNYDGKWNGVWDSAARIGADRWEAVVRIPLETIHADIHKNNVIKGTFLREYAPRPGKTPREYSSWGAGRHHQPITFGSMTLMK